MRFLARSFRLFIALSALWPAAQAMSQTWPVKPIRVIVSSPPGGVDTSARLITAKMTETLGQPFVIENRAGANGFIGTEAVARAAPDGYTLLFTASSTMVNGPALAKSVPFDPIKDFAPVTLAYAGMATIAVNSNLPINTLRELIDYAKKFPGKLTYGSSGIGSIFHLTGEHFKQAAGVDMLHVPYKGSTPAWTDLAAGRIDVGFPSVDLVRPALAAGKVRIIAVVEAKRHPHAPGAPAVAELVPGFEKPPSWIGMFATAGLPADAHVRLVNTAIAAIHSPEIRSRLEDGGYVVIGNRPEEVTAIMKRDLERAAKLIKSIGILPE
ncbi:MAG: Bug family tripartite tricarboxylate transporter substrate binding protein [Burkholderiales bacterium]